MSRRHVRSDVSASCMRSSRQVELAAHDHQPRAPAAASLKSRASSVAGCARSSPPRCHHPGITPSHCRSMASAATPSSSSAAPAASSSSAEGTIFSPHPSLLCSLAPLTKCVTTAFWHRRRRHANHRLCDPRAHRRDSALERIDHDGSAQRTRAMHDAAQAVGACSCARANSAFGPRAHQGCAHSNPAPTSPLVSCHHLTESIHLHHGRMRSV